ncbi:hypothetical protein [Phenylobacterium sp.]|uniref:hypothetical protein n=1 Tax=Phenylobacterium sp. TaxID=1871053 RepID=UPI00286BE614|nr:hypothetical protein [Phenylobacterium sp.]
MSTFIDWATGKVSAMDSKQLIENVHKLVKAFNSSNYTSQFHMPYMEKTLKTCVDGMGYYEKVKGYKADYDVLISFAQKIDKMNRTYPLPPPEEVAAMYKVLLKIAAKYMKNLPQPAKGYAYAVDMAADKIVVVTGMFMHTNNLDPELKSMYQNFLAGRQF